MKLKELKEDYHVRTGKASDLARTTNYSLIAIIWILCGEDIHKITTYKIVLLFILLSLFFDFLQYSIQGIGEMIIYKRREKELLAKKPNSAIDDENIEGFSPCLRNVASILFDGKILLVFVSVILLLIKLF